MVAVASLTLQWAPAVFLACHCLPPSQSWPHVFAASQTLPHLTSLLLRGAVIDGGLITHPPWCAADLSSVVRCCPSLCRVETDRLQPGLHVSEMHKLTALTKLRLGYYDVDTSGSLCECVRGIASLTQLPFFNLGTNSTRRATPLVFTTVSPPQAPGPK